MHNFYSHYTGHPVLDGTTN